MSIRLAIFAVCCIVLACGCGARAFALTEYCPAHLDLQPLGVASSPAGDVPPAATSYSALLSAASPRVVSGTMTIHTVDGWYSVPFANIALTPYAEQWQDNFSSFTHQVFLSKVMYVQFPRAVSVLAAFVSEAQTQGETSYGWDAKGRVACGDLKDADVIAAGVDLPYSWATNRADRRWLNPPPMYTSLPVVSDWVLRPVASNPPGSLDCAKPFADASVAQAVTPQSPPFAPSLSAETYVEVAIGADGKLDDAWTWGPSNNRMFDDAALTAAKLSTYLPARAFCRNVPATYVFRVEFEP